MPNGELLAGVWTNGRVEGSNGDVLHPDYGGTRWYARAMIRMRGYRDKLIQLMKRPALSPSTLCQTGELQACRKSVGRD